MHVLAHWLLEFFEWAGAEEEEALAGLSARKVISFVFVVSEIAWAVTLIAVLAFDTLDVVKTRAQLPAEVKAKDE